MSGACDDVVGGEPAYAAVASSQKDPACRAFAWIAGNPRSGEFAPCLEGQLPVRFPRERKNQIDLVMVECGEFCGGDRQADLVN